LPLVTAGEQPVFLDDTNALLTLLSPGFDPRKTVLLPLELRPLIAITNQAHAHVTVNRFARHRIEAQVEADGPLMVVIGQTFYHQWRAYVDGQPVTLLRANYAFQAVPTPAGKHRIQLKYEDRPFRSGALITGLTVCVCLVGWCFPAPFRQTAKSHRDDGK
jgi:hypothetical protein